MIARTFHDLLMLIRERAVLGQPHKAWLENESFVCLWTTGYEPCKAAVAVILVSRITLSRDAALMISDSHGRSCPLYRAFLVVRYRVNIHPTDLSLGQGHSWL